jgi:hypothetical protein
MARAKENRCQNEMATAGLLLTTEAMISDFPGDDTATAMPGAAGGMDFYPPPIGKECG